MLRFPNHESFGCSFVTSWRRNTAPPKPIRCSKRKCCFELRDGCMVRSFIPSFLPLLLSRLSILGIGNCTQVASDCCNAILWILQNGGRHYWQIYIILRNIFFTKYRLYKLDNCSFVLGYLICSTNYGLRYHV